MDEQKKTSGSLALNSTPRVITIAPSTPVRDRKLRVAAYARVSSSSEDQLNSFAAQNAHYTELITANPEWEFVDVYADKGITGTSAEKRDDFQRLLAGCRRGRVDKILVKSSSRFARNAKECLKAIRELGAKDVFFLTPPQGKGVVRVETVTGAVSGTALLLGGLSFAVGRGIRRDKKLPVEIGGSDAPCTVQLNPLAGHGAADLPLPLWMGSRPFLSEAETAPMVCLPGLVCVLRSGEALPEEAAPPQAVRPAARATAAARAQIRIMVCFKIFVPPKERGKYRRARSAPIIPPKQAKRDGLKEKFTNLSLNIYKRYIF